MSSSTKRTLIVTGQKPITQVKTQSGGDSTLYEVYATDTEGNPIEEPLRAFTELEEGVPVEYDVSRYDHPRYGTSFTLTPPKSQTRKRLRELEEQMEMVVSWAKSQGFKPEEHKKPTDVTKSHVDFKALEAAARGEGEPMESVPAPENKELDERFGADAPWNGDDLGPA
jgi:hypothetical protein